MERSKGLVVRELQAPDRSHHYASENFAPPGELCLRTPPHHPKTAEGFTGLGPRAHISRSTLLLSEAPQMLSSTSRFARLAERASYFSPPPPPPPPPPPSLVLHLHEAQLFLPRCLHLPYVSIIPFSPSKDLSSRFLFVLPAWHIPKSLPL